MATDIKFIEEAERTFLFTDVPCGVMKQSEQGNTTFCGLDRALCFTDLQDIDEADIQRLKTNLTMDTKASKEPVKELDQAPPNLNPAASDTESTSSESDKKEEQTEEEEEPSEEEEPALNPPPTDYHYKEESTFPVPMPVPSSAAETSEPTETPIGEGKRTTEISITFSKDKIDEVKVKQAENNIPVKEETISLNKKPEPANALQASSGKNTTTSEDPKPKNALQAAKAAKKKDGKKKKKGFLSKMFSKEKKTKK